jgi:uncharacterized protein
MTSKEELKAIARVWLDKAKESHDSARLEFEANHLSFAINRLYYAVFYAVSAVLAVRQMKYGKHSAVRAALHRDLISPGLIPAWCGDLFDSLFDDRQEADYAPVRVFTQEDITARISPVAEFIKLMDEETQK